MIIAKVVRVNETVAGKENAKETVIMEFVIVND